MLSLNKLFQSKTNNDLINLVIQNEYLTSNEFVNSFLEEKNDILNNFGYEGFDKSWRQWYCRIITGDIGKSERRILFDENKRRLTFEFYILAVSCFSSVHIKNTVELMNKLNIASVNRGIEDIASAAIKMAVLLKLYECYENSNTLKTIEYHVCKMFENKE